MENNFGIFGRTRMSKIDKIKEKIAYNKFLLGMMIAFALSVGGWIVNNYTDKSLLMVFAIIVEIIVGVLSVVFMKKIDKMIDELEDL